MKAFRIVKNASDVKRDHARARGPPNLIKQNLGQIYSKMGYFLGIGQTRSLLGAIGAKNRRAYSYRANYALENRQCVMGAIGAVKI